MKRFNKTKKNTNINIQSYLIIDNNLLWIVHRKQVLGIFIYYEVNINHLIFLHYILGWNYVKLH